MTGPVETLDDALNQGKATLYRKLAEIAGEVDGLKKTGWNEHNKYRYVKEEDVLEAVRDKLAQRQIAVLPSLVDIGEREIATRSGSSTVTTVQVRYTFCDGETGATVSSVWAGQGADAQDKGLYSAFTGAAKTFFCKAFQIPTHDDPEANAEADQPRAQKPAAASQTSKPATDKQKELRKKLLDEKRPTVAQIGLMLNTIGVGDRPSDPEELRVFVEGLDSARTSALIEQLMSLGRSAEPAAA